MIAEGTELRWNCDIISGVSILENITPTGAGGDRNE